MFSSANLFVFVVLIAYIIVIPITHGFESDIRHINPVPYMAKLYIYPLTIRKIAQHNISALFF